MTKGAIIIVGLTLVCGAGCGAQSATGNANAGGSGGAGGAQTASGGADGIISCTGPVTETQAAAVCAQVQAGSSLLVITDADCGASVLSSAHLDRVFTVPNGSAVAPDAGVPDAGVPPLASISVNGLLVGMIYVANPAGIPAGSQPVFPPGYGTGDGTSLFVAVVQDFDIANGGSMQSCDAQSGDVNVTLPSDLTGAGAEVSFTAHCQPGPLIPAKNLVGCFRL
jgi:hypothetical protein